MKQRFTLIVMLATLFAQAGLSISIAKASSIQQATSTQGPTPLVLIIPPVENVSLMYEKFQPIKEHLERTLSREVVLKVSRSHHEAIESIGTGKAHIAYLDPSAYCEARHRHGVIPLARAVMNGSHSYRSAIVVRKDAGINRIVEAKGKRLALGNLQSSSSYLIPTVMFKEVGIDLDDFLSVDYLEQEDRIALSVLARRHDLGGLSEKVAMKYISDGLKIIKTSEAIPQYSFCACSCLPEDVRTAIRKALLSINRTQNPDLIASLKDIDGFAPAEDRDYDVVRVMIRNLTGKNYLVYNDNTVKVAHLPLYSAITLFDRFDPLMRYLTKKTGYEFKLVIPRDFEDFFDIVRRGEVEFSYSNPYIYIQLADEGYLKAFANTVTMHSGDIFRGIIITHRDSPIKDIEDLRGKRVMAVSYRSAGGFLAQYLFLREHGIDAFKDVLMSEGKRQEDVILNVYRKRIDAGFVRESALDVLKEEIDLRQIRILARTPYMPNWPFAAAKKTDEGLIAVVQKALLELSDAQVLSAAHVKAFKPANDNDFDDLRKWIGRHESK